MKDRSWWDLRRLHVRGNEVQLLRPDLTAYFLLFYFGVIISRYQSLRSVVVWTVT
jgi:hypothetical protein